MSRMNERHIAIKENEKFIKIYYSVHEATINICYRMHSILANE